MSQPEYRKLQKKTDGETLLVTIPTAFAHDIPLQKSDVVKMTLEGKRVILERV
jgi:antitoxin component of MazEF toxin-antitoxin module